MLFRQKESKMSEIIDIMSFLFTSSFHVTFLVIFHVNNDKNKKKIEGNNPQGYFISFCT